MQLKSADAANTQLVPHSPFHMHHMHHLHLRPWAAPGSSLGHRRRTGCGCGADWRAGCEPDYRPVRPTSSPTQPVPDPSSSTGLEGADPHSPPAAPAGEGFEPSRTRRRGPATGSSCVPLFLLCSPSSSSASFPTSALTALLRLSCCLPLCACVCFHLALLCVCVCVLA